MKLTLEFAGQTSVSPRLGRLLALEWTLAQVVVAGFLNNEVNLGNSLDETDFIFTVCSDGYACFNPSVDSSGNWTLVQSFLSTQYITSGNLQVAAGELISGLATGGFVGKFRLYPTTASKGSLVWQAVANSGDTATVFKTAALGQATTYTVPDPATATANMIVSPAALVSGNLVKASGTAGLVADAGARIVANTTAAYAGGGTSNAYTAAGLTVAAKGSAVIRASTNAVSIAKAVPGTDTLTITFSADPGANTTVDYIYATASQA